MKIRIFDQLDSRTSRCFETHLIILAIVEFGLVENPNYVFEFCSGGEGVSYKTYRPHARVTENMVFQQGFSLQKCSEGSATGGSGTGPLVNF